MNLKEACNLIGNNGRVLMEVAKHFKFKEEDLVKDYIDFVTHETSEWFQGFPSKYTDKKNYALPKTAFVKLVKEKKIRELLGEIYCEAARETVWTAYKVFQIKMEQNDDKTHNKKEESTVNVIEQFDNQPQLSTVDDIESVHSVRLPKKNKEEVYETALRILVSSESSNNGLANAFLSLLNAYKNA
jgi:hypothetical protein